MSGDGSTIVQRIMVLCDRRARWIGGNFPPSPDRTLKLPRVTKELLQMFIRHIQDWFTHERIQVNRFGCRRSAWCGSLWADLAEFGRCRALVCLRSETDYGVCNELGLLVG